MNLRLMIILFIGLILFGCGNKGVENTIKETNIVNSNENDKPYNENSNIEEEIKQRIKKVVGDKDIKVFNADNYVKSDEKVVLAELKGDTITLEDFNEELSKLSPNVQRVINKKKFLDQIVDMRLIIKEIAKDNFHTNSLFKKVYNIEKFKMIVKEFTNYRYNKIFEKIKVPQDKVHAYYIQHRDEYKIPIQYHGKQIFISFSNHSEDEAYSKIGEIYNKLKKGESFEGLAKKYSEDDASKVNGGDLGWFTGDAIIDDLAKFFKTAKIGEISKPIKSKLGYHILKLVDIKKEEYQPIEKVREDIEDIIKQKMVEKRFNFWKKQVLSDINSEIKEELIEKTDIPDDTVIATIDDEKITMGDLKRKINELPSLVHKAYTRKHEKLNLLKKMIEDKKIYMLALKQKFEELPEVQEKLNMLQRNVLLRTYIDYIIKKNVYENKEYQDKFWDKLSESIHAGHIFVKVSENAEKDEIERAKRKIENAKKQIESGVSFESIAKKINEDATKERSGDLGWFRHGMMVKPFENAVFKLKKGEISPIIHTKFGYHIIKLYDRKIKKIKDKNAYKRIMVQEFYQNWLEKLRKKYNVRVYYERLK